MSTRMVNEENLAAHFAGLEERVTGLEKGVRDIAQAVSSLTRDIKDGQKTQWPIIWQAMAVAVTILAMLGALAYIPVRTEQEGIKHAIEKLEGRVVTQREAQVLREWHQERLQRHDRQLDRMEEFVFRHFTKIPDK